MVTLGVDCHKRTHTVVAVDGNGVQLASKTVATTCEGHLEGLHWARQWPERRWGLEDCRHVSRRLEADLLRAGESVVRVSPKLMAGARLGVRQPGKSDPIDALAVARVVLREPGLTAARLEGREREVRLIHDHREDLVGERTRVQNRLLIHLHELAPEYPVKARSLDREVTLKGLEELLAWQQGTVARLAREQLQTVRRLNQSIKQLERELRPLVRELAPSLLLLPGCAHLTAAKLLGETADVSRFRSRAAHAMANGSAPIPASSGNSGHFRLNRGGNRQLNTALHRIAITQMRLAGRGRDYYDHRIACKNTKREAIRALRRRISNEVYRRLMDDHFGASATAQSEAA